MSCAIMVNKVRFFLYNSFVLMGKSITLKNTVDSRFATVCFRTIHFYDPCRVGPSTPD